MAQTDYAVTLDKLAASPGAKHALVGVSVKEIDGTELCSLNEDKLLTPASILKVVTTASALELLGSDFRYSSSLSFRNADSTLLVTGSGDPTLGSEYGGALAQNALSRWVSSIVSQNFADAPFRILVDDSLFGYEGISRHWIWEDMGNYYASGSYGVSYRDNTYKLFFNTLRKDTLPIIVEMEPSIPGITFVNFLEMNDSGVDNGYIRGMPFSYDRRLVGDIPAGRSRFSIKGDMPDPGLFLAKELSDELRISGKTVMDYATVRTSPLKGGSFVDFYNYQSPPLRDIIRQINIRSNNHYAEHLIRRLGIGPNEKSSANALKQGIQAVRDLWKRKGLDDSSLVMYDGCGLSPSNAVTPEFLTDVMRIMYQSKDKQDFIDSFAKAGEEGTVRNFLKNSGLKGKMLVKSGSIAGVQCYAGYYLRGDKNYAFTIMVNKFDGSRRNIVKDMEKFLVDIFK